MYLLSLGPDTEEYQSETSNTDDEPEVDQVTCGTGMLKILITCYVQAPLLLHVARRLVLTFKRRGDPVF